MAWNYFEKREQPTPAKQLRHRCEDCHREWIGASVWNGPLDARFPLPPDGACPVCWKPDVDGSGRNVRDIEVIGWFDSTTDAGVTDQILAEMAK
jgi:hypothetical protein